MIVDRAYDADSSIRKVRVLGAEAVIPTRRNRVERFFNRIKRFRRVDYLDFEAAAVCLD